MIRCACSGCSAVLEVADDAAGTAVLCSKCGYLVQVPEQSQAATVPGTASARPKTAKPKTADRRAQYILGGMHGLFVLCLPFSMIHAKDGSPMCLAMFAVNLLLGTGAGFLFLVGMHTPDYLSDWLHTEFTRLRALVLLLPLSVLGFLVAMSTYAP